MQKGLMAAMAAGCLFAQEPTIRVDVRQVLVPVVVTDKKGHHVGGLKASDFQVFEDGVRQDIAAFTTDRPEAATAAARQTFVIVIDTLHTSAENAARVRQALASLFESERPAGAQYVLMAIGRQLQVLQPATANPAEVLVKIRSAAWQNVTGGMEVAALVAEVRNVRRRLDEFCNRCACSNGARSCDSEVDTLKQTVDGEAERWNAPLNALASQFKSVVEELAKLPTGRTLILVSDGFNLDAKREFYAAVAAYLPDRAQFKLDDASHSEPFHDALKVAAERNVTIYTIDSRTASNAAPNPGSGPADATTSGMGQNGSQDVLGTNRRSRNAGPVGSMPRTMEASHLEESASLREAAQVTGGVYFHDSGEMLKQLRSAVSDGREYYVLAYVPKNSARDGKYRTITVEPGDKRLTLRAKAGYWADGVAQ
jgi:VWFA-related protein